MMPLPGYAAGGMPMAYAYPPEAYSMPGAALQAQQLLHHPGLL
jgi:hypothetical protein